MNKTPQVVAVIGPSGAGKSSLCDYILESHPHFVKCRTATNRKPRGRGKDREIHGVHYDFWSTQEFARRKRRGELLEAKKVHGNHWYGIPRENLFEHLRVGKTVFMCIDIQGFIELKGLPSQALCNADLFGIFVTVPHPWKETLRKRLENRTGGITEEELATRLITAQQEINRISACDCVVVNDDFEEAAKNILQFINRRSR